MNNLSVSVYIFLYLHRLWCFAQKWVRMEKWCLTQIWLSPAHFWMYHKFCIISTQLTLNPIGHVMKITFDYVLVLYTFPSHVFSSSHAPHEQVVDAWKPHSPPFQICMSLQCISETTLIRLAYSWALVHCCKQQKWLILAFRMNCLEKHPQDWLWRLHSHFKFSISGNFFFHLEIWVAENCFSLAHSSNVATALVDPLGLFTKYRINRIF